MKKVLVLLLVVLSGCATGGRPNRARVHHVVLCWLKDSGNAGHRRQIVEVSRSFKEIPGVLDVKVGESLESDRKIVDDSFDVAISLSFANTKDLAEYLVHPAHEKAKKEVLLPLISRILVYDFRE